MSYKENNSLVKNGIVGENITKYFLCNIKDETFIKFNHDYKFDIKTNKGTYEIKTDNNFIKYNSFFCEFMSNNKPSGINTTESDYYIFIGPNNEKFERTYIFLIETNKLKWEKGEYNRGYHHNRINIGLSTTLFCIINIIIC